MVQRRRNSENKILLLAQSANLVFGTIFCSLTMRYLLSVEKKFLIGIEALILIYLPGHYARISLKQIIEKELILLQFIVHSYVVFGSDFFLLADMNCLDI